MKNPCYCFILYSYIERLYSMYFINFDNNRVKDSLIGIEILQAA